MGREGRGGATTTGTGAGAGGEGGGIATGVAVGVSATEADGVGGAVASVAAGGGVAVTGTALVCAAPVLGAIADAEPVALDASLPSRRGRPSRMPPTMATDAAAPPQRMRSRRLRRARVISDKRPDEGCVGEMPLGGIDTADDEVVVAPPTPRMMSRSSSSVRLGSLCASHARTASRC